MKRGGKDVGAYVRMLGTLEVVSVKQDKRARGVIVEANQEIERGAKVGPLVKHVQERAAGRAEGRRAGLDRRACSRSEQLIGEGEVVFIDLGKSSGVEVGNRMFVVRRGDAMPRR